MKSEDDKEDLLDWLVRKSYLKGVAAEKVKKWKENPDVSDGDSVYSSDSYPEDLDERLIRKYEVRGREEILRNNSKDQS